MLDFIIMGMVLKQELTGYDIKKNIENGVGTFYKASYGSLYPSLRKLTDKGYLIMHEKPYGGRQKNFYRLTEEGKGVFEEWLTAPVNLSDGSNTQLVKVYFFDLLPYDIRNRKLLEYELNNTNYLQKLVGLEKEFDKMENKDCFYYKLSTLYYGICITRETIRWCRHIREGKPLALLMNDIGGINNDF